MSKWTSFLSSPRFMLSFHKWATIFWVLMIVPSAVWWRDSLPYLVGLSVYAVITGHWSSYQATRVERNQESENITDEAAYKQIIEATARIEAEALKEALLAIVTAADVKSKLVGRADALSETVLTTAEALKEKE